MSTKTKILLSITSVLVCLGTVSIVLRMIMRGFTFQYIMIFLMYFSLIRYSFVGYKKPNGHQLKGLFLRFEVIMLTFILTDIDYSIKLNVMVYAATGMCVAYIAADLKNVKVNKWIMLAVSILLLIVEFRDFVVLKHNINFIEANISLAPVFMWTALCSAFFTRYLRYKEDGLKVGAEN